MERWLSHSQSGTFAKCRKQYAYKYLQKLKPLARDLRLESWLRMCRGIIGHGGMEYAMLGLTIETGIKAKAAEMCAKDVPTEFKDALMADVPEYTALVHDAAAWLPISDWTPVQRSGIPMVEARLELPLPAPWTGMVGFADMVATHKPSGRVLVIDYKFRQRFEAEDADIHNRQFAIYQHALNEDAVLQAAGIECHGSLLFEIKSPPPKRVSKIVRDDVGSIDTVRVSADGRFRTTPTYRSKKFVAALWADSVKEAVAIGALTEETAYRTTSAFTCNDCAYLRLCHAELNGADVSDVTIAEYSTPNLLL